MPPAKTAKRVSISRGDGFVSEDDFSDNDSASLLRIPPQGFQPDPSATFFPLYTPPFLIFHCIIMIGFEVMLFLEIPADFYFIEEDSTFLLCSLLHAVLFLLSSLLFRIVFYFHKRNRNLGYLAFDRRTRGLRQVPLTALSFGLAGHLVLFSMMLQDEVYYGLSRLNFLQVLFSLELLVTLTAELLLLFYTFRFNQARPPPDSVEDLVPSFTQQQHFATVNETGYGLEEHLDDVISKQGDMIRYLKHQKNALSERILELTDQLRQYEEQSQMQVAPTRRSVTDHVRSELAQKSGQLEAAREEVRELTEMLQNELVDKEKLRRLAEENIQLYHKEKRAKECYIEETEKMMEELRAGRGQ